MQREQVLIGQIERACNLRNFSRQKQHTDEMIELTTRKKDVPANQGEYCHLPAASLLTLERWICRVSRGNTQSVDLAPLPSPGDLRRQCVQPTSV